jgi:hypothetical protein
MLRTRSNLSILRNRRWEPSAQPRFIFSSVFVFRLQSEKTNTDEVAKSSAAAGKATFERTAA